MKFSRDNANSNRIVRYEPGSIHIIATTSPAFPNAAPLILQTSFIITADQLITDWTPQQSEDITDAHIDEVLALRPDVILLGTGKRLRFPAPHLLAHSQQHRVGIEVMDTAAACRTYNLLAAEGRKVAAALLMIDH